MPVKFSLITQLSLLCVGFVLVHFIERWLIPAGQMRPIAWLTLGFFTGAMVLVRMYRWPWVAGSLSSLYFFFDVVVFGQTPLHSLNCIVLMLCAGGVIIAAPMMLMAGHRRDYLPHELLPALAVGTVIAAIGFALLQVGWPWQEYGFEPDFLLQAYSVFVGVILVAPPLAVSRLPYGRPLIVTLRQRVLTISSGLLFVVCCSVELGFAENTENWIGYHSHFPFLIAFLSALIFSQTTSLLRAYLFLFFGVTGGLIILVQTTPTLDWSAIASASERAFVLIAGPLACSALLAGVRRLVYLDRHRRQLMMSMLSAETTDNAVSLQRMRFDLTEALRLAGQYCFADQVRLYRIEEDGDTAACISFWRRQEPDDENRLKTVNIRLSDMPEIASEILLGQSLQIEHSQRHKPAAASVVSRFALPHSAEMYVFPIISIEKTAGFIVLIAHARDHLRRRNAPTLLQAIADYYLGYLNRERYHFKIRRFEHQLSELAARFSESEQRVRRNTSVELHDGPIQQLAVLRMKLGELKQKRVSAPDAIDAITEIVDETLAEARSMLRSLSPSVLYELGLVPAVQNFCDQLSEDTGFDLRISENGRRVPIDEPLRIALYHALCELITNGIAHSGGGTIWVTISWDERGFALATVSDDGQRGAWWIQNQEDLGNAAQLGLLAVRERLQRFDLAIDFTPRPGGGTRASIRKSMFFDESEPGSL
ncbi:MAG: histidine kinase [Pseudomonadota bacterium]